MIVVIITTKTFIVKAITAITIIIITKINYNRLTMIVIIITAMSIILIIIIVITMIVINVIILIIVVKTTVVITKFAIYFLQGGKRGQKCNQEFRVRNNFFKTSFKIPRSAKKSYLG